VDYDPALAFLGLKEDVMKKGGREVTLFYNALGAPVLTIAFNGPG
jgi:hypothetical protein